MIDYEYIRSKTLEVYIECKVKSFPLNCIFLLKHYGLKCKKYSDLSLAKQKHCFQISEDAFTLNDIVFYNDNINPSRIMFTLMHELGHKILSHTDYLNKQSEIEANTFASNIIAPRIAIHYSSKNYHDVMNIFGLSEEAANIAFDDYKRWRRYIITHNNKISELDKNFYNHFYNKKAKKFVYKSSECLICGRKMYNTFNQDCDVCTLPRYTNSSYDELNCQLLIAESNWLYGE
ncbi:ImmA/IrrE family metallo-endopeptidase [Anaerosporobacter sp.]|uniref:ImmA/IrrE family metallo-endopeptidase n=1 Tax=Anaerosporobacter sp. TaxID=1872529 RepID=UPI00286F47E1|nr:ImmA/IrrE family metallo-endopeptidase [Anaerosporobacter sp.]